MQIIGVAVMGIGIWVIVEEEAFTAITGETIISGAGILIAAGAITIIIAVLGIFGCIHKARPMLFIVRWKFFNDAWY